MAKPSYKRVMLKLSGEALAAEGGYGIDPKMLGRLCDEIKESLALGVQIGLVVGGGNIFRGTAGIDSGVDKPTGDYMGMLATMLNALAIQAGLEARDVPTRVLTAIEMRPVAEPYIRRRAVRHLEKNRVVIFGAGTGNPFFTTDTAAALRANEIHADALLKATQVDGVYTADPKLDASATLLPELTFQDALEKRLKILDATAFSLCMENDMPIHVFRMQDHGNILRVVMGERIGSVVR